MNQSSFWLPASPLFSNQHWATRQTPSESTERLPVDFHQAEAWPGPLWAVLRLVSLHKKYFLHFLRWIRSNFSFHVGGYLDEFLKQCFPLLSEQNKGGCCSYMFTRFKLFTSPKSIKKWYIFIYYFARQQECKLSSGTPSITAWLEWKACCIQGPKDDLLCAVSTANRILVLYSRKMGIC